MRQLLLAFRRCRWRLPPPPPLFNFSCNYRYHTSSSYMLFNGTLLHPNQKIDGSFGCSLHLCPVSYHIFLQPSRRFSTKSSLVESVELFFPVKATISLLDSYHDLTGFPWWFIISSSTVVMRLALLPLVVLQLKKLDRIGKLMPKLPPPFLPLESERSFRDQFALFWKEKKAARCPSFFWFFSSLVQIPCFALWLMSVRRMALSSHPGFDGGGILWFQNLTEYRHDMLGLILPLMIAGLHFTNIQISFRRSSLQSLPGTLGLLTKAYRTYLLLLTLPILFGALNVPQASLVYWLTNSSLNLIQLLCLRNPDFRKFLGLPLPESKASDMAAVNKVRDNREAPNIFIRTKQGQMSVQYLSPDELVSYSIKSLTDGHKDRAIECLRLALEKDPGNFRALLVLGQTLLQKNQYADAIQCLDMAISKLLEAGCPTKVEEVDLLILSSQWAGIANAKQGKMEEAVRHLERIAQLKEPEDSKGKAHYYDGLLVLSSALQNVDRKEEALKYMRMAAAYNPAYIKYLDDFETDREDFASDLANSRRQV